jgi:hypothetical protein
MNKKIITLITIFILNLSQVTNANQLSNKPVAQIDNLIITELDLKKEIIFIKFISKSKLENIASEILKKEALNNLIERKIKSIEILNLKAEISEKESEFFFYNYLKDKKINEELLYSFCRENEIENDYLIKVIKIDASWTKIIQQIYANRINVNMTEINKDSNQDNKNITTEQLINVEKNILLNKFATIHLEKVKKKYLIKIL